MAQSQKHVMISYQWDNKAMAAKVAEAFKARAIPYWIDVEEMSGHIQDAMAAAVEKSWVVIPFMTEKYQLSANCKKELSYADRLGTVKIIPILSQKNYIASEWLGFITAALLYFDFTDEAKFDSNMDALVAEIYKQIPHLTPGTSGPRPTSARPSSSSSMRVAPTVRPQSATAVASPVVRGLPQLRVDVFSLKGAEDAHPSVVVDIPPSHKIVGGGAVVNWTRAGNLLTAAYPVIDNGRQAWVACAKDHMSSDPATITGFCVAVNDPDNAFDVAVFTATSDCAAHPSAVATIPPDSGFTLVGGGAFVQPLEPGSMLYASYPSDDGRSWQVNAKDHLESCPARATAFAIGLRARDPTVAVTSQVFSSTSASASHPLAEVRTGDLPPNSALTCGGGYAHFHGSGSLLCSLFPSSATSWVAKAKDHCVADPGEVTSFAIVTTVSRKQ
eukprot:Opistho-2@3941